MVVGSGLISLLISLFMDGVLLAADDAGFCSATQSGYTRQLAAIGNQN
jgi:hypothetical protein